MKKILLAATGSVAVVKLAKLKKLLDEKYDVKVIVSDYVFDNFKEIKDIEIVREDKDLGSFPEHIKLAKWADLILVAPATANTLSKFNAGIADNPLLSTLLAARTPIIFAPAMNTFMYEAICRRGVIDNLSNMGCSFIGPDTGRLREGESGLGRMTEPEEIVEKVKNFFSPNKKNVIVTYGASKVKVDAIRFISNNATGKLGKMIINELKLLGHNVKGIDVSRHSNSEVLEIIKNNEWDAYISTAAFADILTDYSNEKIGKKDLKTIELKQNIDVLTKIREDFPNKKIIGFKHDNNKQNAINKMEKLSLNYMVWNKVGSMGNNKISGEIIGHNFKFENTSKNELAREIARLV